MLKTEHIHKYFDRKHGRITAINDISLEIKSGDFVSITGPSGSGKSTLLLMLGGMSTPNEGKVFWEDTSVFSWNQEQRARWRADKIGFVFQSFNLIPYLTVYENVKVGLSFLPENGNGGRQIDKLLEELKLDGRKNHLPSELSVGQQQRVALARAIIKNPPLILADEPTGNLDPETGQTIIDVLLRMNDAGKTVVIVTHDPSIAGMTKRSIRIVDGRLIRNS